MTERQRRGSAAKQDEVVTALYNFAVAIGAPIQDSEGREIDGRRDQIEPALTHIMDVFGYRVVEIQ